MMIRTTLAWALLSGFGVADGDESGVAGFRGDGSGVYPEARPPVEWSETRNVRWKTRVGGGYSSPVCANGSIYVTSDPPALTCVEAATGKVRWTASYRAADLPAEFREAAEAGENGPTACGYAAPTPVADGSLAYAVFGSGLVACHGADGARRWLRHLKPLRRAYGHSSSPLLVDGRLIVNLGHLIGLDPATGTTAWEAPEAGHTHGTPAAMRIGGAWVVVTPLGNVVRVRDGAMMATAIADDLGGDEYGISPVASGDVVYLGDRTTSAVKLELRGDKVETRKLWSTELANGAYASPVVSNGLFHSVGKLAEYTVLDAATGEKVHERILKLAPAGGEDLEFGSANVYPSLSAADGKILVGNDVGQIFVLKAGREYVEIARNRLPEGSASTPAIAGSSIFIRAGEFLYAIGRSAR